jgi:hypothetical protein
MPNQPSKRRPAPQVPRAGHGPGYWMNETSGGLRPAVEAYLNDWPMTPEHVASLRAYFRQWMAADWAGPRIEELRTRIDSLDSKVKLERWLDDALELNIDPL